MRLMLQLASLSKTWNIIWKSIHKLHPRSLPAIRMVMKILLQTSLN